MSTFVEDIPMEVAFAAPSTPANTFQIGDIVTPDDRKNLGEVIEVEPDRIKVRLVDKHKGLTAELYYPGGSLQLVRRATEPRVLTLLTYRQLQALPPSEWLVYEILRRGELAALFGPPGSLKTFIAIDVTLRVAIGCEWWGCDVVPGFVVYIAAEGLYSIKERTRAWVQQFDDCDAVEALLDENFAVLGEAVSFLEADFEHLMELIRALPKQPVLIIVDTLARCMAGGDENNAKEMGLMVRASDRLRKATGATVLLVHHSGKSDAEVERGSSALRGACDSMFSTAEIEGGVRLSCSKQKEGPSFEPMDFALDVVEVGIDEKGRPRRSGRIRRLVETQSHGGNWVKPDDAPTTIQKTLADSFFEDGAAGSELKAACKLSKQTFHRHLKELVDHGVVLRGDKRGHYRYRLSPESIYYKAPPVEASSPSPTESSPTSPRDSNETQGSEAVETQTQSHGGSLEPRGDGTGARPATPKKRKTKRKKGAA